MRPDFKPVPSQDVLNEALQYDPETGKLCWKERVDHHFARPRDAKAWNSRYAGKPAFTYVTVLGYACGRFQCDKLMAHRVIWMMVHGQQPEHIDHVNGDRSDNRLVNLRSVTKTENARNLRLSSRNKSGHVGVHWHARSRKWTACIGVERKLVEVGQFRNIEDAIAAREAANVKFGFHPNHGKK